MTEETSFSPNWLSPPGETIAEILRERRMSSLEFAKQMGQTAQDVEDLLCGRAQIGKEVAQRLSGLLGASASFWMNRELQYREDAQRLDTTATATTTWLRELPIRDMIRRGWLKAATATEQAAACLAFFGVSSVSSWREAYSNVLAGAAFRTSSTFESDRGAVAAWLRQGEIVGASVACQPWNPQRFRDVLPELRSLTRKKKPSSFLPALREQCAQCGVAVAIVPTPTGCRASGATRFVSSEKALLMLSFRYLSDDHFWFTFFHEAGHLLLHAETALFLEDVETPSAKEEIEANVFARDQLIPPQFQPQLPTLRLELRSILRFARSVGVSPGIVVGQLQHSRRVPRNHWNDLKVRFDWDQIE